MKGNQKSNVQVSSLSLGEDYPPYKSGQLEIDDVLNLMLENIK